MADRVIWLRSGRIADIQTNTTKITAADLEW